MLQKLGKNYIFYISLKCRHGVNEQGLMTNYVHMGLQQSLQLILSYLTTCSWTHIMLIILIIRTKSLVINLCSDVSLRNDIRQITFKIVYRRDIE